MRVRGILSVAFFAFKVICAGPHWSRGGIPYGKNITVRATATLGTVPISEITSTSPGTISPHWEHTSPIRRLNTTKVIIGTHYTSLKSSLSRASGYGYNATTVVSKSGTSPSHGTYNTYITPYPKLSGHTTTPAFISGTRPSYGIYSTYVTPYKTSRKHNSTSSLIGRTTPSHGTHGTSARPYQTSPKFNFTSSNVSGTRASYRTYGTDFSPYKTSPKMHHPTSNGLSGTSPSHGTYGTGFTPYKTSREHNSTSSIVSVTGLSSGTYGTPYKTSPKHNSTSYTVGGTRPSSRTHSTHVTPYTSPPRPNTTSSIVGGTGSVDVNHVTYVTPSESLSPSIGHASSTPFDTARQSYGTSVSSIFRYTNTGTAQGSLGNTTRSSYGTQGPYAPPSGGSLSNYITLPPFVTAVSSHGTSASFTSTSINISTIHGNLTNTITPSHGFPVSISNMSTNITTVYPNTSIIHKPSQKISANSIIGPVTNTSAPTHRIISIGNVTSLSNSTAYAKTTTPSGGFSSSFVNTTKHITSTAVVLTSTPALLTFPTNSSSPQPSIPMSPIMSTILPLTTTITSTNGGSNEITSTAQPSSTLPSLIPISSRASPITTPASRSSSQCCFVVQDTIDYNYWTDISTSTLYYTTVLTSLITHVSSYVDTAVTSVQTSYLPYTGSEIFKYNNAEQPLQKTNNAPGGPTTVSSGLGGTATVTYAQTIHSPDPFFLYRTAKIILVPAVTESNGQLACVTTSTFYPSTFDTSLPGSVLFTGINSYAQQYFSSATATTSATVAAEISLSTPFILPLGSVPTKYTSLTLPTPAISDFVTTKPKMARAVPTGSSLALNESVSEYGYVPNFFISFLAQDPNYVAQFPDLASCFPGGPSIDPGLQTSAIVQAPTLLGNLDLQSSATSVTYPSGCFNPDSSRCSAAANSPSPSVTPVEESSSPSTPSPQASILPSSPPTSPPPLPQNTPAAQSSPAPARYNPNELSPSQLSNILSALQVPASSPAAPPSSASPVYEPEPATPASPVYNPDNLSPSQLSNIHAALQVSPSLSTPPSPPVRAPISPTSQPPTPITPGPESSSPSQNIPPSSPAQFPPPNSPGPESSPTPQNPPLFSSNPSPSPSTHTPGPVNSPAPQETSESSQIQPPSPTSLQTTLSLAIIAGPQPSESATTMAEPAPAASIVTFKGGASRHKVDPLSSLWAVSLGGFILIIF